MIANVSPSVSTFGDTYNTLKYANRAKNIKTQVIRNTMNVQYHISNYNQIITNLKNEISELKSQLAKKDYSLNNVINNKFFDSKKEDIKDNNIKIGNQNKLVNTIFEKSVSELKIHCEDEISAKQKIIDIQHEIRKINQMIIFKKNELKNYHLNNNKDNSSPKILEQNEEISSGDEMENNKINVNSLEISNSQMINNNSSGDVTINLTNIKENKDIQVLEGKLVLMKRSLEKCSENFKELVKKREFLLNSYSKNGVKDFYFEYLQSILKAHNLKLFIIENRFKEKFNNNMIEIKENYISVLEDQLKIRDDLIKKNNISNLFENEEFDKVRPLDQLKIDYSNKLPIIQSKFIKDNNSSLDSNYSFLSGGNLPPINKSSNNIQSILNEIKSVNNSISRIESDSKNNNNLIRLDQKIRFKNDISTKLDNISNIGKIKSKKIINNIPNKNMNIYPIKNENSPGSNLNNYNNFHNSIINPSGINSQNKNIQGKYILNNNIYSRKSKQIKINLINSKKKENISEKSDLSHEYDSYMVDFENSRDDSRIKNSKNRRSAQPKLGNKNENFVYSPLRNADKKNPTSLKKIIEDIPQIKKKDLNIFLNEKNKYKSQRKIPFKL